MAPKEIAKSLDWATVPRLKDPEQWISWKTTIQDIALAAQLEDHLEAKTEAVQITDAWKRNDAQVRTLLRTSVDSKHHTLFIGCSIAQEMWTQLKKNFEQSDILYQLQLVRRLNQLKLSDYTDFDSWYSKFRDVATLLKQTQLSTDQYIIGTALANLTAEFDSFCTNIHLNVNKDTSMDTVLAQIFQEKRRQNMNKDLDNTNLGSGAAFIAKGSKSRNFNTTRRSNRRQQDSWDRKDSQEQTIKCYTCQGNHKEADCYYAHPEKAPKGWLQRHLQPPGGKRSSNESQTMTLYATCLLAKPDLKDDWLLDSGATRHMCNNLALFHIYEEKEDIVQVGKGSIPSKGVGTIQFESENGHFNLSNVLYVPELASNLLSLSQLKKSGCHFSTMTNTLLWNGRPLLRFKEDQGLFKALVHPQRQPQKEQTALLAQNPKGKLSNLELWHRRLGHPSLKTLCQIKGLKASFKDESNFNCSTCFQAKSHRRIGKAPSRRRVTRAFQLCFIDVVGPITPISHDGYRYYMIVTDAYTKARWIFLLEKKGDAFKAIKQFIAMIKREFKATPEAFRLDNGKEYGGKQLVALLDSNQIQLELTAPYSPEQNGQAERAHAVVDMKARCLLLQAGLPQNLWPYAIRQAVRLANRTPIEKADWKTPYSLLYNKEPDDFDKLFVFGCKAFAHIPQEKRVKSAKFAPRAEKGVYLGMESSQTHYIWIPSKDKVVRTRDFTLDEASFPYTSSQTSQVEETFHEEVIVPVSGNHTEEEEARGNGERQDLPTTNTTDPMEVDDSFHIVLDTPTPAQRENRPSNANQARLQARMAQKRARLPTRILPTRSRQPPTFFQVEYNYQHPPPPPSPMALLATVEPRTFQEATKSNESTQWWEAMKKEHNSLLKNETWKVVSRPSNTQVLRGKWVYKIKENIKTKEKLYKARYCVQGQDQDVTDTFSGVVDSSTWLLLLALSVVSGLQCHQVDIDTAFLYGKITDTIYVELPEGFKQGNMVALLHKALYGLKTAPKTWFKRLRDWLLSQGFTQSKSDSCVFFKLNPILWIVVYVDDLLILAKEDKVVEGFKSQLKNEFSIKDIGPITKYLGMEVYKTKDSITLTQKAYISKILDTFGMTNCKPTKLPFNPSLKLEKPPEGYVAPDELRANYCSMVGSCVHLECRTRPDISYAIYELTRHMANPTEQHVTAAKSLLRYLKGTKDWGIQFSIKNKDRPHNRLQFQAFADADFANNKDRHSLSGLILMAANGPIWWKTQRQSTIALSTTEAEYYGYTPLAKRAMWVYGLLEELGVQHLIQKPIQLFGDNQPAIQATKDATKRSKHFDIKYHFIRELIENEQVAIHYTPTETMKADGLTKPLSYPQFDKFRQQIGVIPTRKQGVML